MTVRLLRPLPAVRLGSLALLACAASPCASATCSVSTASVEFGRYEPLSRADKDGFGRIDVTCDSPVSYTVAISGGGSAGSPRRLSSGADSLLYNLYTDAAHSSPWGSAGSAASSATGSASLTVFGRIAGGQNAPPGTYSDLLMVTIAY